jgi:hypothetical protein
MGFAVAERGERDQQVEGLGAGGCRAGHDRQRTARKKIGFLDQAPVLPVRAYRRLSVKAAKRVARVARQRMIGAQGTTGHALSNSKILEKCQDGK